MKPNARSMLALLQRIVVCSAIAVAALTISLDRAPESYQFQAIRWTSLNGQTRTKVCPFARFSGINGALLKGICVQSRADGLVRVQLPGWDSAWLPPDQIDQGLVDEFHYWLDKAQIVSAACAPPDVLWLELTTRYGECRIDL